jgi:hypothetical protein
VPTCAVQLGGDVSSFIVTSRGGAPLTPGSWAPEVRPVRAAAPK